MIDGQMVSQIYAYEFIDLIIFTKNLAIAQDCLLHFTTCFLIKTIMTTFWSL